jgi:hypothetical protein
MTSRVVFFGNSGLGCWWWEICPGDRLMVSGGCELVEIGLGVSRGK